MPDLRTLPATLYLTIGALAILLGVVIFRENVRERIHRATATLLLLVGLKAAYEGLLFVAAGGARDYPVLRSVGFLWEFFFPTLLLFASIFPREHGYMRRVRWGGLFVYLPHTFHFLLLLYLGFGGQSDLGLNRLAPHAAWARGLFRLGETLFGLLINVQVALFSLVNIGYIVAAVALLAASYRASSNQRLRGQLRIITAGLGTCVGIYTLAETVPVLLGYELDAVVRQALVISALTLGAGSIAYSIVRYRFLDTQLLARRSILYAVVTALLVGIYLTLVRQVQMFLARVLGRDVQVIEPVFLVLALILFQPVLQRLEEMIDRWFLRDRLDHRNILRQLSRDIISILDRRELTRRIVSTLAEGVMARHPVMIDFDAPPGERIAGFDLAPEDAAALEAEEIQRELAGVPLREEFIHRDQIAGRSQAWGSPLVDLLYRLHVRYLLPVRHGDRLLGMLLLGRKVTGVSYTAEEVSLLTTLANQVGVALQNAGLYAQSLEKAVIEEELALARKIQERLLPSRAPAVDPFEVAAINVPSKQVGGDFYDLVDLKDGRLLIAIADVAGKGVPAALLTSMLQASLRAQIPSLTSPARMLASLNELIWQFTASDQFATFFLGVLDGRNCTLTYANAGHNFPLRVTGGGRIEALEHGGLLLGAFPGIEWTDAQVSLAGDDRLIFYTDGVTEARPEGVDEEYGEGRFQQQVARLRAAPPGHMMQTLLEDVAAYAGEEQADDITLIIVQVGTRPGRREEGDRCAAVALPID